MDHNKLSNISVTDCQWEPTGRFFASWVSSLRDTPMQPHFRIFDYNGNELYRKESKPFSHFIWRPLLPSLLNDEDVKGVRESMKMIVEEYEQNSALRREEERKRVLQQKQDQERAFVKKMQDIKNKMEV